MSIRVQSPVSRRPRAVFSRALRSSLSRSLFLLVCAALAGCAGGAWNRAVDEDTPAAYYRFLRDHAESKHAAEARERLEYHKLLANPSLAAFEAFRKRHPQSALLASLKPALEKPAFDLARTRGTASAYREFLSEFPSGPLSARAIGNATYLEAQAFRGDPARLADFARLHPESDFAAEATRTAETVAARARTGHERLGVRFAIAADTPEARRVRQTLEDRIRELALRAGIQLSILPDGPSEGGPDLVLEVQHHEEAVTSAPEPGRLGQRVVLGVTRLALQDAARDRTISERQFEIRVEDKAHVPGTSVLFSAAAPRYWQDFFVPFARWNNDRTVRPAFALDRPVVDIEGMGDRSVVLYENGDFDLFDLADPHAPVKLASYVRGENFKKWSGVRVIGQRVAIFGEEGLELVRFDSGRATRERSWTRGEIGRVLGIAPVGGELVTVGAKGMQIIDLEKGTIRRAMRRVIQGLDAAGAALVFADGESIFVSKLDLVVDERVIAQMKLGRTFGPDHVRVIDRTAIVTGPGGALVIDISVAERPRVVGKLYAREIGEVFDATRIDGRIYLVGQRGLQVLNRKLDGVEETVDVGARTRVSAMGRHLVTADAGGLQVVDGSPWAVHSLPASAE
ncbi:MAG: hypothetical protein R3F21_17135 [Myxococcota bacterium]